jgi:hypothetical protein
MTTIVALAARDFIAVGADSLSTTSAWLTDPMRLAGAFFETTGALRLDNDGKPVLTNMSQIWDQASSVPLNQLPSVTKLFAISGKNAAILFAGASRIGDASVKNIVDQYNDRPPVLPHTSYTIEKLAEDIRDFIRGIYDSEIPQANLRPTMEVLLAGYSSGWRQPEIFRMLFRWDLATNTFRADVDPAVARSKYDVVYGGQYDVIQRVVHGIDVSSYVNLKARCDEVLKVYRDKVEADLQNHGHVLSVVAPNPTDPDLDLFSKRFGGITGISANVSDLSEQAGIEFVRFLITTMMKAQEFSSSIPTVGGEIHLAVLTKNSGFQWVNKPYIQRAGDSPNS